MKYYSGCDKIKKNKDFHKSKREKSQLSVYCKKCKREEGRIYRLKNKEKISKRMKIYHAKTRHLRKIKAHIYYLNNKKKISNRIKIYREKNKEHLVKKQREYSRRQYKNDIKFRLSCVLRTRINKALKGENKSLNTMFLIGCEIDYLMYHLQCKFKQDMTWDNYGDWHIDHIKPCVSFDLSKPSEQRKCFHYTNLQPLWAKENQIKHKNYKEI